MGTLKSFFKAVLCFFGCHTSLSWTTGFGMMPRWGFCFYEHQVCNDCGMPAGKMKLVEVGKQ